jgi:hypothetical protein
MVCLLMPRSAHVIRLPLAIAPMAEKFCIAPLRRCTLELDAVTGIFYSESSLLKSFSLEAIKAIRSRGLSKT